MKKLLKLILAIGLIFSFASCKEEDRLKIDNDLKITDNTVLTINGEEVNHADFPNAEISFEQLKSNSIIITLKNLVLGHPEVEILCSYAIVKSSSDAISFTGTGTYTDKEDTPLMNIDVTGVVKENAVITLEIDTKYHYAVVGSWKPEEIIMNFSHPTIDCNNIDKLAELINKIIKKEKIFDDVSLTLTADGYIGQKKIVQYQIDNVNELFYIYVRYTTTQELIKEIDDSDSNLTAILKMLDLYDVIKNMENITFPFKYKLEEDNNILTLSIDEKIMKPYKDLMQNPINFVKEQIRSLQFENLASNQEITDVLMGMGIDNAEQFEYFKALVKNLLDMLIDPDAAYQIGVKFRRLS